MVAMVINKMKDMPIALFDPHRTRNIPSVRFANSENDEALFKQVGRGIDEYNASIK
jgi:hypothetical protein